MNMSPTKLILVAGFLAAAFLSRFTANSQELLNPKQPDKKPKGPAAEVYYESNSCFACHNKPQPFVDPVIMPIICRCNEFEIWETTDKHRLAYLALKGQRAKTIGRNLKIDVQADKACVSCHSVWIDDPNLRKEKRSLIEDGVSCFVCHGEDRGWLDMHGSNNKGRRQKWRDESRASKHVTYGMADLWDPAKRTKLCASCHVGNAAEGKVLTHEIYAAGHPPLPSFDMSNFSDAMRHWQTMSEKPADVRKTFNIKDIDAQLEQINLVSVGSLVVFREAMALLSNQASKADTWPELAQFDCYSCHHELKKPSWRQERGYLGKPGRPQLPDWSTVLVELALHQACGTDAKAADDTIKSFRAEHANLRRAFDAQPFGNRAEITAAAKRLAEFIDQKIVDLQSVPAVRQAVHQRMLAQLLETQKASLLDHESARQVAGAFRAIYADGWKRTAATNDIMKHLHTLDDELSFSFRSESRRKLMDVRFAITKDLAEKRAKDPAKINAYLDLKLESLQNNYTLEMATYLKNVNNYDPHKFREKMNQIADLLSKDQQR